ncbi:MAG: hypothetical protein AXA67_12235 [Methylothermaceae bacteria B42]|nr:MAG: hypothetical protein AXA67_12235 [Methylothermaceae bacteria B42]
MRNSINKNTLKKSLCFTSALVSATLPLKLLHADNFTFTDISPAIEKLNTIPENSWIKLNTNQFQEVWTPSDQIPNPPPEGTVKGDPGRIIGAWSSMAWDSKRGDLIFYGGGHANYTGNDVYRWRASTLQWERASLPSAIKFTPLDHDPWGGVFTSVFGVDDAPVSAHTYDNSEYLPTVDRFVTFGGAAYGSGPFRRPDLASNSSILSGPYFWDPSKADPNKVGGATGSQVNPAKYPQVVGGNMWQNRDNILNSNINGRALESMVNGATAYTSEGGKDVLYIQSKNSLFKYTVNDLSDPSQDAYELVGTASDTFSGQGAGAYSPDHNLFLRMAGITKDFNLWLLDEPGENNKNINFVPQVVGGVFDFQKLGDYGMDYDPVRQRFILWGGDYDVWELLPPSDVKNNPSEWTLNLLTNENDPIAPSLEGLEASFRGVLGKWKYSKELDAFLGVVDPVKGDVWAYKPDNWQLAAVPLLPSFLYFLFPTGYMWLIGRNKRHIS